MDESFCRHIYGHRERNSNCQLYHVKYIAIDTLVNELHCWGETKALLSFCAHYFTLQAYTEGLASTMIIRLKSPLFNLCEYSKNYPARCIALPTTLC
jgi:hypothetical protein